MFCDKKLIEIKNNFRKPRTLFLHLEIRFNKSIRKEDIMHKLLNCVGEQYNENVTMLESKIICEFIEKEYKEYNEEEMVMLFDLNIVYDTSILDFTIWDISLGDNLCDYRFSRIYCNYSKLWGEGIVDSSNQNI